MNTIQYPRILLIISYKPCAQSNLIVRKVIDVYIQYNGLIKFSGRSLPRVTLQNTSRFLQNVWQALLRCIMSSHLLIILTILPVHDHLHSQDSVKHGSTGKPPENERIVDFLFCSEYTGDTAEEIVEHRESREVTRRAIFIVGHNLWGLGD